MGSPEQNVREPNARAAVQEGGGSSQQNVREPERHMRDGERAASTATSRCSGKYYLASMH